LSQIVGLTSFSNRAIILKAAVIAASVLTLYFQDIIIIFSDALQDEATSYILVIPLLFLYFIYRKRKMLHAVIPHENTAQPRSIRDFSTLSGVLLSATAVLLYGYGSYTFTPLEYHLATLPMFATGLILIFFNPQTLRQAAFPIAFLLFLTPPPSEVLYKLGSTLSVVSSEASNAAVSLLGIKSTISNEFGNPSITITRPDHTTAGFTVDIACSGIYGLIGFFVFAAFVAYITRDKAWKKATIFLLGLPIVYLLNIIRITTILLIGYQYGEQLALQAFHLLGGWALIFLGTIILLAVTEKAFKMRIFTRKLQADPCPKCNSHATTPTESFCTNCGKLLKYPQIPITRTDIAKITALMLVVVLLLSIQAPVFALTRSPAQIVIETPQGEQGNTEILPQMPGYALEFVARDTEFEKAAEQNASLVYAYINEQTGETVWVAVEVASTHTSLHGWEVCLISWPQAHRYQPSVTQLDLRDVQILQNPPIIARYFAFEYTEYNQPQVVLYWFETSIFNVSGAFQQSYVKISLITYPNTGQNITDAESRLMPFAVAIANHWQPMKTWAQITIFLSQNSGLLATTTTILLVTAIFLRIRKMRTWRTQSNKTYQKLSRGDKQIIDAIHRKEKTMSLTFQDIAETQQETTKQELYDKLAQFSKAGLVSEQTSNQQDEPIRTWKTELCNSPTLAQKLRKAKGTLGLHREKTPIVQ
jgi:exosortase